MRDYFDFEGVRFSPKAIVFDDIRTEEERTGYFTLRNVSKRPVKISVINPKSKFFRVLSSPDHVMLSPGLKVNSGVKLRPGAKESEEMFLVIHINNRTIFYPILVHIANAQLHAVPTFLDFGTVDLNTNVPSKTVILHNTGALSAKFSIDVAPESAGLEVTPLEGTVPGKGHVPLDVKVPTSYSGVNHLYFWIKSQEVIMIYVKVTVIKPYLEIHHPCTSEEYTLLCFPPLYYGTQYNHTLIVRNISANDSMFGVLAAMGNEIIMLRSIHWSWNTLRLCSMKMAIWTDRLSMPLSLEDTKQLLLIVAWVSVQSKSFFLRLVAIMQWAREVASVRACGLLFRWTFGHQNSACIQKAVQYLACKSCGN